MQNIDIAHQFFYSDFDSYKDFNNVGFNGNLFFSYSTVIGAVVKDRFNNNVLLVSQDSMTPTTGRHISNLIYSCPFSYLRVPMRYGKRSFSLDECINDIVTILDNYSASKLSLKANRDVFIQSYEELIYINNNIQDIDSTVLEQYKSMYELLTDAKEVKALKIALKEKDKQDRIKAQQELNELQNTYSYMDLIRFAYDNCNSAIKFDDYHKTKLMQKKIKKALNPLNDLSFVWVQDENTVRTSQNIRMSMDKVKTGLKLWKNNKIRHGYQLSYYTVLEVRENYVQIGCHKIPMDNIKALYETIFSNEQEKTKELQVA